MADDQQITCRDCGANFTFTAGEQEFYASKNLSAPQRCKDCRAARKTDRGPREMHDAVCSQCGVNCQVPFKPRAEGGKPILCRECFMAHRDVIQELHDEPLSPLTLRKKIWGQRFQKNRMLWLILSASLSLIR